MLGLACHTARNAITAKPTSMIASAVHFGTPGSSWLPDSRSERTNTQLAQAKHVETAANPAAAAIFAGPRHDSGSIALDDNASNRSDRDASIPPSIPIHRVSCCTMTADPGIPGQRNCRATISITGSAVISDSARIEKESSKSCRGVAGPDFSGIGAP